MSKIHTTVRVGVDGSLTLPAFFMRGMGYEPGEEVPITTPANQYIIVPSTEELRELSVELCCLLNELGISPLTIPPAGKWRLP